MTRLLAAAGRRSGLTALRQQALVEIEALVQLGDLQSEGVQVLDHFGVLDDDSLAADPVSPGLAEGAERDGDQGAAPKDADDCDDIFHHALPSGLSG